MDSDEVVRRALDREEATLQQLKSLNEQINAGPASPTDDQVQVKRIQEAVRLRDKLTAVSAEVDELLEKLQKHNRQ
jgi:hypothetical protein